MKNTMFLMAVAIILLGGSCTITQSPSTTETNQNKLDNQKESVVSQPETTDKLNLSNQNLSQIPNDVFNKTNLEELNVSSNKLTGAIQGEIRHLSNLKVLNLSNNQMTGVPAEIGQLSKLEVLDLSNNELTGLPYELGNLQNLKTLNVSGNNYSAEDLKVITDKLPNGANVIK